MKLRRSIPFAYLAAALLAVSAGLSPVTRAHEEPDVKIRELTQQLQAEPNRASLYTERAGLYRKAKRYDEALADYGRALDCPSPPAKVRIWVAGTLREAGRSSEAADALRAYLADHPADWRTHLVRARLLRDVGHTKEADAAYRALVESCPPGTPDLYLEWARALAGPNGRGWEAAGRILQEGLDRLGPVPSLEVKAMRIDERLGRVSSALTRWQRLASTAPDAPLWRDAGIELARRTQFALPAVPSSPARNTPPVGPAPIHGSAPKNPEIGTTGPGTTLVPEGATWRFQYGTPPPGRGWKTGPKSRDWNEGPAPLGYGDPLIATELDWGTEEDEKPVTAYFRRGFRVEDPDRVPYLQFDLLRDDGAVVYVNGKEVWRDNLPPNKAINHDRTAIYPLGGEEEGARITKVVPVDNLLKPGENQLAVEVHQYSEGSSDLHFDLALTGWESSPPPRLLRGPYLQSGTPDGAVIRWATDVPSDSRVWIGRSPETLHRLYVEPAEVTEHEVRLTGLDAATTYSYAVGDAGGVRAGGDANHHWTTSPEPGTPVSARIWVLGDSGLPALSTRSVRDSFYSFHGAKTPDLWLMLGDNAYEDGTLAQYQAGVFDMFPETLRTTVLWPTLGNHDGHTAYSITETGPYYDLFTLPRNGEAGGLPSGTEAYFSFDYGNIHFINLNSYDLDRSPGGAMAAWLVADLAANRRAEWTIAFWHHPPYSKGSHDSDKEKELVEMRETFLPLLEAGGVDLVLSGHSHNYERSRLIHGHYGHSDTLTEAMVLNPGDGRPDGDGPYVKAGSEGTVYTVAGSSSKVGGGAMDHPIMVTCWSILGSLILDVEPDRLTGTFIDYGETVRDTFELVKPRP